MTFQNFAIDTDADGIALVTWNMPGRSMNVIDGKVIEELAAIVEQVATDGGIKGAVLTSGKDSFCGGRFAKACGFLRTAACSPLPRLATWLVRQRCG